MSSERYEKLLAKFLLKQEEKKIKLKLRKEKNKKNEKRKSKKNNFQEVEFKEKKKKVGRPKKRGPKKKRIRRKIVKVYKEKPVFDYKIVSMINGKQNGYIGAYQTYNDALTRLSELENDNNKIIFPRKYLNKGTISLIKDEYLLLEKNRHGDKNDGMIRNEFGKFIKQKIINSNKWIIRGKISRKVEETFWVYGFDPKTDRKTYTWIYENLIINSLTSPYDIIRIIIYKNKLIIKYDDKPMSMVMCKNQSDSIRMYNIISDTIKQNKIKQIICIGIYNSISEKRRNLEKEIIELTGWSKMKIQRSTN